jgi:hypothetical protein
MLSAGSWLSVVSQLERVAAGNGTLEVEQFGAGRGSHRSTMHRQDTDGKAPPTASDTESVSSFHATTLRDWL